MKDVKMLLITKPKSRLCSSELPAGSLGRKSSCGLWEMFSCDLRDDSGLLKHYRLDYSLLSRSSG